MAALLNIAQSVPSRMPTPARIGERLVARGVLSPEKLHSLLEMQSNRGGRLGNLLLHYGAVREIQLQAALAEQANLALLPLGEWRADGALLQETHLPHYLAHALLPLRREDTGLHLATTEPHAAARAWARAAYPTETIHWQLATRRDLRMEMERHFGSHLTEASRSRLGWKHGWHETARLTLLDGQRRTALLMAGALLLAALLWPRALAWTLWWVLHAAFASTLAFKAWLLSQGLKRRCVVRRLPDWETAPWRASPADTLPIYTVLVPLYRETAIIPALIRRLSALDYPRDKLDIKLIVETDDAATHAALKLAEPPPCMEIIVVPPGSPRTKPRACNYALPYARGELLTIYDAEDAPKPDQLRHSAWAFAHLPPEVACLQASLHYYNRHQNWLTRCFALEYGLWFEAMLPGLERGGFPIPLGGTSNHLRRAVLEEVGAWDAYNVTEDADLGLRLLRHGYRTCLLPSATLEEAPVSLGVWVRQRTRWIKGYMQTWCVHLRLPVREWRRLGLRHALGFHLFIGGPCLFHLATPVLLAGSLAAFLLHWPMPKATGWISLGLVVAAACVHWAAGLLVLARLPELPRPPPARAHAAGLPHFSILLVSAFLCGGAGVPAFVPQAASLGEIPPRLGFPRPYPAPWHALYSTNASGAGEA